MATHTQADLEGIRDVAIGYMNKVISETASYQESGEGNPALSSELKRQVKANCVKRVEDNLANLSKTVERFNSAALSSFDPASN